ncbi:hypothetical protein KC338_g259 [Hortaea werneckii]|nr:hypothetical protein KC338_g259 [Hortaea werneckii]
MILPLALSPVQVQASSTGSCYTLRSTSTCELERSRLRGIMMAPSAYFEGCLGRGYALGRLRRRFQMIRSYWRKCARAHQYCIRPTSGGGFCVRFRPPLAAERPPCLPHSVWNITVSIASHATSARQVGAQTVLPMHNVADFSLVTLTVNSLSSIATTKARRTLSGALKRDSLALQEDPYESSPYAHPEQLTAAGPGYTPTMTRHRNYDISKAFDEFYDDSAAQKSRQRVSKPLPAVTSKFNPLPVATSGVVAHQIRIWLTPTRPPPLKPSLANHLMSRANDAVTTATQQSFLSHAGCGTLSPSALNQWLTQEIHISRALITFVGALIGKIRIPETSNLQADPTFRALDLLCSAVNNMKKELEFLESSKRKPLRRRSIAPEQLARRARRAVGHGALLLQFLPVCLELHVHHAVLVQLRLALVPHPRRPYDARQPLQRRAIRQRRSAAHRRPPRRLHPELDIGELRPTTGNGRTEMQACERVFRQAIWLWGQIWPEVDGMGEGEEEHEGEVSGDKSTEEHDEVVNGGVNDRPIEIDDDAEGEATVDSPYGGTGLGAIAAHNQVGEPMDAERS